MAEAKVVNQTTLGRNIIVHGPNIQGWACIVLFSIWSYESSSLWPIVGFVGISLLCGLVALLAQKGAGNGSVTNDCTD